MRHKLVQVKEVIVASQATFWYLVLSRWEIQIVRHHLSLCCIAFYLLGMWTFPHSLPHSLNFSLSLSLFMQLHHHSSCVLSTEALDFCIYSAHCCIWCYLVLRTPNANLSNAQPLNMTLFSKTWPVILVHKTHLKRWKCDRACTLTDRGFGCRLVSLHTLF